MGAGGVGEGEGAVASVGGAAGAVEAVEAVMEGGAIIEVVAVEVGAEAGAGAAVVAVAQVDPTTAREVVGGCPAVTRHRFLGLSCVSALL